MNKRKDEKITKLSQFGWALLFLRHKKNNCMSHSVRKTPIFGIGSGSEKQDKRNWNKRFRSISKTLIRTQQDPPLKTQAVTDVWDGRKDGKIYRSTATAEMMRK